MNVQFFNSNISSFGKMIYQYGMLEIREKVANVPACSSLWVNGDGTFNGEKRGCMTEYDLNENYGRSNYVESCIHHWSNNQITGKQEHFGPDSADYTGSLINSYKPDYDENGIYEDYHIYTFLWEEDKIVFAFDGVKYCEYDIPDWYRENAASNIILSCGMGTNGYGTVYDPVRHEDYLESYIDYVKIYKVEDMGSKLYFK
jgi:beta-glucanase (GH16 family)